MSRCLVLIDGEHYPPVVERTLDALRAEGHELVAALFLGGTEKTAQPPRLSIPVDIGEPSVGLNSLIDSHQPELVIDLSDEPVLDHRRRFELVAVALARGVSYQGAGYRFDAPRFPGLTSLPTVAVTGTGKRTGKTAVAIELARHWREGGKRVCIVTMGRGGPPEPVVLRAGEFEATVAGLTALAARGLHAASDYVEDAAFAGVDTVGTYRCGAGISGETDRHNFAAGMAVANGLSADLLILEGSGTALPPARADAQVLVMPVEIDVEYLQGYLGPYRVRMASAAVIIDPSLSDHRRAGDLTELLHSMRPDLPVITAGYRLEPSVPVEGRNVLIATTAPASARPDLTQDLLRLGAASVDTVHSLSDRRTLVEDLEATTDPDLVLIEIKAAAVDLVVPWAAQRELEIGLIHNRVLFPDNTAQLASVVEGVWAGQAMSS